MSVRLWYPSGNFPGSALTPLLNASAIVVINPSPSRVTISPACSLYPASGSHFGGTGYSSNTTKCGLLPAAPWNIRLSNLHRTAPVSSLSMGDHV